MVGHVCKKLDRVVVDVDWQLVFPTANVEVISQHGSDHNHYLYATTTFKLRNQRSFIFKGLAIPLWL